MKKCAQQTPNGVDISLAAFIIMQIGTMLVLVAVSFSTTARLVVFCCGVLLLLAGLTLFLSKLAISLRLKMRLEQD